ncbi:hypothetical protein OH76DRAFT_930294 [Lentinus brumalis]|uniref:Uncharacterized protein n=1 Tax=Lentinus brumalis TaxID=2498619 RepID=A0A371CZM5_9APHY|nr:hypothetical protein OH76DRAFT_930294 [Polyporus brumalis]
MCIKLTPDNTDGGTGDSEDVEPPRGLINASLAERVEAHLVSCPKNTLPICRICKAMVSGAKDRWMILPCSADAIVYHVQAKHGRKFAEEDILFERPWYTEFAGLRCA